MTEHVQLVATSLIPMNRQGMIQQGNDGEEKDLFNILFQVASSKDERLLYEVSVERVEQLSGKIKQLLEQAMEDKEMKEDLFHSLPIIPAEELQLFTHLQVEANDWSRAIESVLENISEMDGPIESFDVESVAHMISTQLLLLHEGEQSNVQTSLEESSFVNQMIYESNVEVRDTSEQETSVVQSIKTVDEKAINLIRTVMQETSDRQVNAQITRLLEQSYKMYQELASLEQFTGDDSQQTDKPSTFSFIDAPESLEDIWNNLQAMYDKRAVFTEGGAYKNQAKVRTSDVALWMSQMIHNVNVPQIQQPVQLHQQMAPVEQYVLQMNMKDGTNGQHEQMMQQLKQIVMQSGLGKNDLFQQLSIQIQPEQLGDLKITLLRVEGELIAKIIVHSQVAKHALESQMHQLKHLFSPHQVFIEKQEGINQTSVDHEYQQDDMDDDEKEQDESSQREEQENSSFQEQFEQIIKERTGE